MKTVAFIIVNIAVAFSLSSGAFADSLWVENEQGQPESVFTDQRASKVGDIITVLIVESATASQKADSSRNRKTNIAMEVKRWSTPQFYHGIRTDNDRSTNMPAWEVDAANTFGGGGTYTGNYNLRAQITTRIVEVLPNKNLFVEGTSEVFINRERNIVSISGIIRPQDITTSNTVFSTQLAEAKVKIIGKGPLNDKTGRGVLETILDWVWPF